jgi:hypothetical protein
MKKMLSVMLFASVATAAFLAFAWPFVVSSDQDSRAYHFISVGVLLSFLASLVVLCALRLREGRGDTQA